MKSIHITRNITLQREGQEDVVLQKGHHTVADDVAEHPFVKHHTSSVADAGADTADLQALLDQTRIAAQSEIEHLRADLEHGRMLLQGAHDEAADLRTALNASNTDLAGALQRAGTAEQALAAAQATITEQQTTLAAYAAMTPAADTKAKK